MLCEDRGNLSLDTPETVLTSQPDLERVSPEARGLWDAHQDCSQWTRKTLQVVKGANRGLDSFYLEWFEICRLDMM